MIKIIDATLREGLQSRAKLNNDQILEIAKSLDASGVVDQIECGHASISKEERDRIQSLLNLNLKTPILTHARANINDIDWVIKTGIKHIGIFIGINEVSQKYRLNKSLDEIFELIKISVEHAKKNGLYVRFTIEDSSRTDLDLIFQAFKIATDAGADRICFSDTLGLFEPNEIYETVTKIKSNFSQELEIHLHDDRGLAMANSLAGIKAGADWISVSVNGIGERAGITDLCSLMSNLHYKKLKFIPPNLNLRELSKLVSVYSRTTVDERRPTVGEDVFSHVAKLHINAIEKKEDSYSWISPEILGGKIKTSKKQAPFEIGQLINKPFVKSATELKYHRAGVGDRYVMINDSILKDTRQYCIVRDIPMQLSMPETHVDTHTHLCDSLFLFTGKEKDLKGLKVEVILNSEKIIVESPASVFIPSGFSHSYNILSGEGYFVNHVLSGDYNSSLFNESIEEENLKSIGWDIVGSKFWKLGSKAAKPSIKEIEMFTQNISLSDSVAVVGASTKDLIQELIDINCKITVFDFSKDLLNELSSELNNNNITYVHQDILSNSIDSNFFNKFDYILSDRLVNRFCIHDLASYYLNMIKLLNSKGELRNSIKIGLYPMDKLLINKGKENNTLDLFFDAHTNTIDFSNAVNELKEVLIPHGEIDSDILLKWYFYRGKESRFSKEDIMSVSKLTSFNKKQFNQSFVEFPDAESTYMFNFKCIEACAE